MATGVVDREEWAKVVQELLDLEARPLVEGGRPRVHGAKTRFAEKVGLKTPRTLDTWLRGDVDVREASVKQVAEGYELDLRALLIRVGFYREEQLSREQLPRFPDAVIDEEQRAVLERDDLDDEQKAYILQELDAMRDTDERLLAEQRERDKQRRADRIAILIANAHRGA